MPSTCSTRAPGTSRSRAPASAYENALEIIRAQKWLRINWEYEVQQFFINDRWLIVTSNYFYGAGYVVSTLFALIWLYRRRPDHYPFWRNTLAIGTLLGLLGFRFYPLMPPRLLDVHLGELVYGFVDTLKEFPTLWSFDNSAMEKVSNQYAAMPSLHCGWAIWVMVSTFGLVRTQVMKVVVVLLPVTTIFVVVVTANHYLLDAVGGLRHHDHRLRRLHAGDPGRLRPLPGLPHEGSAGLREG